LEERLNRKNLTKLAFKVSLTFSQKKAIK